MATKRQGLEINLVHERLDEALVMDQLPNGQALTIPRLWWRRGRVELPVQWD